MPAQGQVISPVLMRREAREGPGSTVIESAEMDFSMPIGTGINILAVQFHIMDNFGEVFERKGVLDLDDPGDGVAFSTLGNFQRDSIIISHTFATSEATAVARLAIMPTSPLYHIPAGGITITRNPFFWMQVTTGTTGADLAIQVWYEVVRLTDIELVQLAVRRR